MWANLRWVAVATLCGTGLGALLWLVVSAL